MGQIEVEKIVVEVKAGERPGSRHALPAVAEVSLCKERLV